MVFRRLRMRLASLLSKLASTMSTGSSQHVSFLNLGFNCEAIPIAVITDLAHMPNNLSLVRKSLIIRVRWLKGAKWLQHEALDSEIRAPSGSLFRTYWLLADRGSIPTSVTTIFADIYQRRY